ncbi:MAG: hypothetical protein U9R34_08665 [Nanoarchaeota archaeon]|nr:hypothetical protein [Nanoarchaeota archaeon]
MGEYKGYKYFLDKDKLWKIILSDNHIFIVALDDSKTYGNRKIIWKNNNEETCKKYIDLIKN